MVRSDFATIYVERLQKIIYPKGYVVCFSSDGANSAMWGNYAKNHTGACLVYETKWQDGQELMDVKNNWCITNKGAHNSFCLNEVKPIIYSKQFIERNFFESLGRLTGKQIKSWLVSESGEESYLLDQYYDEDWREWYWKDFAQIGFIKTPDWAHEKEYRLQIDDSFYDYGSQDRLISYNPESFIGVVFGMKTSDIDKIRIISAIKDSGRDLKDFHLYQIGYNEKKRDMDVREINYWGKRDFG